MRLVPLTRGLSAMIDEEDFALVAQYRWTAKPMQSAGGNYYVMSKLRAALGGKTIYMHRVLLDAQPGQIVDHVNRNPLDNRRSNLRFATARQNAANSASRVNSQSGFRGVLKERRKFLARLDVGGVIHRKRGFFTAKAAALFYDQMAREKFGEFAILNFPDGAAA